GMPLTKFHFYTYTLILAALLLTFSIGLVRLVAEQAREQPGVLQFMAVVGLCTGVTVAPQGGGGGASLANTMFPAPPPGMLAFYLDDERRQTLTALIIWFVAANAVIGIGERIAGVNLFVFSNIGDTEYFRATALLGHPLENAFVTSSVMFLIPAMSWPPMRK